VGLPAGQGAVPPIECAQNVAEAGLGAISTTIGAHSITRCVGRCRFPWLDRRW
jgi:hypothetical protein